MQLAAEVTSDCLNTVPAYVFRGTGITLGSGKTAGTRTVLGSCVLSESVRPSTHPTCHRRPGLSRHGVQREEKPWGGNKTGSKSVECETS